MNDDPGAASVVAALYVDTAGPYYNLADVDPWDETRDAREYEGPHPVVAHPPCNRWSKIALCNPSLTIGDDGGTFAAALGAIRTFGGVLEHPAHTFAWAAHSLHAPTRGCWSRAMFDDGWVTEVSQVAYGHPAQKRTWLYLYGTDEPPAIDWSEPPATARVDNQHSGHRSITPPAFRDLLLDMARTLR